VRALVFTATLFAVSSFGRAGFADEPPPARWSLAVDGGERDPSCSPDRLAREVELACDALRGCVVVSEGTAARAVLHCGGGRDQDWVLEATDPDGARLWSQPIPEGGDRMRRAAMWIARAPTAAGTVREAPEGTPSEDAIPLVTPLIVAAPAPLARDAGGSLNVPPASKTRASGVLVGTRAGLVGSGFGPSLGGRAAGAISLRSPNLALDVALSGARTLTGTMGYAYSSGHAGVGVSWGAPWGTSPIGFSLEGGAALGAVSGPPAATPASQTLLRAYGEASFTAQWRGSRAIRPFATLAVQIESGGTSVEYEGAPEASLSWITASLDVGVAWRSW
jgi:hypothetical protein